MQNFVVICFIVALLSPPYAWSIYQYSGFRVTSMALESYDRPGASDYTLRDMGNIKWYKTTTKRELSSSSSLLWTVWTLLPFEIANISLITFLSGIMI